MPGGLGWSPPAVGTGFLCPVTQMALRGLGDRAGHEEDGGLEEVP